MSVHLSYPKFSRHAIDLQITPALSKLGGRPALASFFDFRFLENISSNCAV